MWHQFHSAVMIRNRSRSAMTTKQQAYSSSQSSSSSSSSPSPTTQNYKRSQVPSFFGSPRFKAFTKAFAETDVAAAATVVVTSPTSILDTKQLISPFCNNSNPFWDHDMITLNPPKSPKLFSENKQKGIGLALIDVSTDDHKAIEESSSSSSSSSSKPNNVLFGTKLRVQIPPLPTQSPKSPSGSANYYTECLSVTEMELSEEYTCVISHGPNPKTTHIFDNCIIESFCSLSDSDTINSNNSAPENFLCFCYTCKKNLDQKNDIYIYRGEKAFCSQECRYQEMLLDDQVEN